MQKTLSVLAFALVLPLSSAVALACDGEKGEGTTTTNTAGPKGKKEAPPSTSKDKKPTQS